MRAKKHNKKILVWILIFISIGLFFLSGFFKIDFLGDSLGFVFIPVQKFFVGSCDWVGDKFSFIKNISKIEKENIRLKEKLKTYELDKEKIKILEAENKKLNDLVGLKNNLENYDLTGANVIAKDNSAWLSVFIIDKGLANGLKNNMVVLSSNGLVGKIIDCKNKFSKVSCIIDEKSSVSIKNFRTGDLGFAKGNLKLKNNGLCLLEFLDKNAEIIEGDEIVTSHLSDIFPNGLLVGHVQKINMNKNKTQKEIILEPACNLKNLEHVLVIKKVFYLKEQENILESFNVGE